MAKEEEAKWRAKWLKVFPTLTFHFEIGAEESTKQQRHRVIKLGAVSVSSRSDCMAVLNHG